MIILAAYVLIFAAMVALAAWVNNVLNGSPCGRHAKADEPAFTVGDALAEWLREHLDLRACIAVVADDIAHWRPWRTLQIRLWVRQLRRAVKGLRVPAAASAPGEGTVPDVLSTVLGAVPLAPGAKLHPYRDKTPTRADRYSLRVPSYHSDPAEAVGAATGDFPRLMS